MLHQSSVLPSVSSLSRCFRGSKEMSSLERVAVMQYVSKQQPNSRERGMARAGEGFTPL